MKKRILLIDDEPEFTNILKVGLEAQGYYHVHAENDPGLALQAARDFAPDVVVLDIMMPHLDGSDVATKLKNDPHLREVPLLFMTALVSEDDTPHGSCDRGGNTFLPKLTPLATLIRCIDEKIRQKVIRRS